MSVSNQGFALISAIFILVVLGLLGVFVVRIAAVGNATTVFAMEGERAYYAAMSGFQWGAYQANVNSSCSAGTVLSMTEGAMAGFSAIIECYSQVTSEGTLYWISAKSQKGNIGSADYVSRTVKGVIVK